MQASRFLLFKLQKENASVGIGENAFAVVKIYELRLFWGAQGRKLSVKDLLLERGIDDTECGRTGGFGLVIESLKRIDEPAMTARTLNELVVRAIETIKDIFLGKNYLFYTKTLIVLTLTGVWQIK